MKRTNCTTQLELPGMPVATIAEIATAKAKRAAKRACTAARKAARAASYIRGLKGGTQAMLEDAGQWLAEHAHELVDFDCDTQDAKPGMTRTHDGEGAHPVEAVDALDRIGNADDPLALLLEAEALADTDFNPIEDVLSERARLLDDIKQRTPETTWRRWLKKAKALFESGQLGFTGPGWAL